MRRAGLVAGFVALVVAVGFAQRAPGTSRSVNFRLGLPLTERNICNAALQWGSAVGIPVGVECRWDTNPPPAAESRLARSLDLSGLGAVESLQLLTQQLPGYTSHLTRGFAILRRTPLPGQSPTGTLERIVPAFTLEQATLNHAAEAVYALLNPSFRAVPRPTGRGVLRQQPPAQGHPISVNVSNASIETILTAICQTHGGDISWRVAYLTDSYTLADSIVQFLGRGVSVTAGSNRIEPARVP
jgi:hypothetical protein